MTFYVENEADKEFSFDISEVIKIVCEKVLETEKCPFEKVAVNVLITDNDGIHEYNKDFRGIDKETDVLSFPNLDFDTPGKYVIPKGAESLYCDPDTGDVVLGDIIISADRVYEQAADFGHSVKREFAFLVAHSMLHLSGYDHMTEEEASVMEEKQKNVLELLGITRDIE